MVLTQPKKGVIRNLEGLLERERSYEEEEIDVELQNVMMNTCIEEQRVSQVQGGTSQLPGASTLRPGSSETEEIPHWK